jgi:hypothetical protein
MGPFGSGKTSLLNLFESEIQSQRNKADPDVWTCRVSCWGFDDSSAALGHVLSELVAELSRHVDSLAVRSLPERYRQALSAIGSWWQVLGVEIASCSDPVEQLKRLDSILLAVNARIVISIEDVDRNESRLFDQQQIQAMLQRFRGLEGITFILSAGSTQDGRIDFSKLCDHVETLRTFSTETLLSILNEVRHHCLNESDVIDPAPQDIRESFQREFLNQPHTIEVVYASIDPENTAGSRALISLVNTPRILKRVIRHLLKSWDVLKGEIDFDDLFITYVLRYGAPKAFDFLFEHFDALQIAHSNPANELDSQALARLNEHYRTMWNNACSNSDWDSRHAQYLMFYLLPNARDLLATGEVPHGSEPPQGIRNKVPTDYWQRLVAEDIPKDELRDQEVLRLIDSANRGDTVALAVQFLADARSPLVWEVFGQRMRNEQLLPLATEVVRLLLERDGSSADGEGGPMIVIWNAARRVEPGLVDVASWLESQLVSILPQSVRMCVDLFDFWASGSSRLVDDSPSTEIRRKLFETAQHSFTADSPDSIIKALDRENPHTLSRLIHASGENAILAMTKDWNWLGLTLLAAIKLNPKIMGPQIAHLFGTYSLVPTRGELSTLCKLDHEAIEEMFGARTHEIYTAISKTEGIETDKFNDQPAMNAVRVEAKKWLDEHGSASDKQDDLTDFAA